MDLMNFLANAADALINRYRSMVTESPFARSPRSGTTKQSADEKAAASRYQTRPQDAYLPSNRSVDDTPENTAPTQTEKSEPKGDAVDLEREPATPVPGEKPKNQRPDGTYYFRRQSTLDYQLNLEFNLQAMSRVAASIENGDTASVEEFMAGGFGLSADLAFRGSQTVETNMADRTHAPMKARANQLFRSAQANMFNLSSRTFQAQGFYRDATSIRRSMHVQEQGNHRRAVNRFAFRFQMDNQFSFAHLTRFNTQTQRVMDEMPENTGSYLDSAGAVAAGGTDNMMATFFDAVDAYLDQAEDQMVNKVNAFFDMAAEELGFSEGLVDMAREHLLGSVESFFDRVETAMSQMGQHFRVDPTTPESPDVDNGSVTLPDQPSQPSGPAIDPTAAPYTDSTEEKAQIAMG